ncbi:MAG: tight adherence protein [Gaiellales bacterium]|nr:tight adherence protein [Gaiellales bacterium]
MILVLIGALVLMGTAVALLGRAIGMSRARTSSSIAQIDSYGFSSPAAAGVKQGAARGLIDGVAGIVGQAVAARLGGMREAKIRQELMAAGLYTMTPKRFIGYRAISAICVPVAGLWMVATFGLPPIFGVFVMLLALFAGWSTPSVILRRRMDRRFEAVEMELPELIDLLVVTVESGLGFNGALHVASTRIQGPLGDELRLALQEQTMGLSTEEALRNMLDRCETPSMRAFVRSVLQGETLGVSIGQILRGLADEMRKRRKAMAEEKAQRAPIKILFPLIFLIFPAMFIVLLGPAIFSMGSAFGGG